MAKSRRELFEALGRLFKPTPEASGPEAPPPAARPSDALIPEFDRRQFVGTASALVGQLFGGGVTWDPANPNLSDRQVIKLLDERASILGKITPLTSAEIASETASRKALMRQIGIPDFEVTPAMLRRSVRAEDCFGQMRRDYLAEVDKALASGRPKEEIGRMIGDNIIPRFQARMSRVEQIEEVLSTVPDQVRRLAEHDMAGFPMEHALGERNEFYMRDLGLRDHVAPNEATTRCMEQGIDPYWASEDLKKQVQDGIDRRRKRAARSDAEKQVERTLIDAVMWAGVFLDGSMYLSPIPAYTMAGAEDKVKKAYDMLKEEFPDVQMQYHSDAKGEPAKEAEPLPRKAITLMDMLRHDMAERKKPKPMATLRIIDPPPQLAESFNQCIDQYQAYWRSRDSVPKEGR